MIGGATPTTPRTSAAPRIAPAVLRGSTTTTTTTTAAALGNVGAIAAPNATWSIPGTRRDGVGSSGGGGGLGNNNHHHTGGGGHEGPSVECLPPFLSRSVCGYTEEETSDPDFRMCQV